MKRFMNWKGAVAALALTIIGASVSFSIVGVPVLVMGQKGTFSVKATLASAVAAADTANKTIWVMGYTPVTDNLTIPATRAIKVMFPGYISITDGKILTFAPGTVFDAGLHKVFVGAVTGLSLAYPQWWDAKGDGATDDTAAFQRAVNAVSAHPLNYPDYSSDIIGIRYNLDAYSLNQVRRWSAGTTDQYLSLWRCTTAGTTAASAPSITGKVVGNTVSDGSVVWTMISDGKVRAGKVYVPESTGSYMINAKGRADLNKGSYMGGIIIMNPLVFEMHPRATLQALPLTGTVSSTILNVRNVDRVSIIGGRIVGDRATHVSTLGGNGAGLRLASTSNVTVRDLAVFGVDGDGLHFNIEFDKHRPNSGITVDNVVSDGNYRNGLSILEANAVRVAHSQFSNNDGTLPKAGIDIEPDYSPGAYDIILSDNTFLNNGAFDIVMGGGVGCSDVIVNGGVHRGGTAHGISLSGDAVHHATNVTINGPNINMSTSNYTDAISVVYAQNVTIDAIINGATSASANGIYVNHSSNVSIGLKTIVAMTSGNSDLFIDNTNNDITVAGDYRGAFDGVLIGATGNTNIKINGARIHDVTGYGIDATFTGGMITGVDFHNIARTAMIGSPVSAVIRGNFFNTFGTANQATYVGIDQAPERCVYDGNVFLSSSATQRAIYAGAAPTTPSVFLDNVARYGTAANVYSLHANHIKGTNYASDAP